MQALRAPSPFVQHQQGSCRKAPVASRAALLVPRAAAEPQQSTPQSADRRTALLGLAALAASAGWSGAVPQLAYAGNPAPVKEYLPAAEGLPGFCIYTPDAQKTPGIRAGVVKPEPSFYRAALPDSWAEAPLLNPQTGNFCMPRCEEPWYEFKFEGKEGTAQLVVTELQKLGAKPGAKVEDLGAPDQVVTRIGNFITGTYLEEEDIVSAEKRALSDGRNYYLYEVYAPYSKTGGHNLAAFTTKGALAYLYVLTASDKQWGSGEATLRKMIENFQA